jgi:hypothetical protein
MGKLVALPLVIVLGLMLLDYFQVVDFARSQAVPACVSAQDQEYIRALTNSAIDSAFQAHVMKLYDVWLKDYSPEPKRAMGGMANGISAYQRAYANAKQWQPQVCPK